MPSAEFSLAGRKVYVAGHRGMVGSALVRRLTREGSTILTSSREETDLRNQAHVERWFGIHRPEVVFMAAARVGGIHANNTYRAEFIYDNLAIALNVVHAAYRTGVEKLMFLGSTCIYPRDARQPMDEAQMLQGPLEETNEPYAIAKIAGIKLVESYRRQYGANFISVMPTNLYGPGDSYHSENSHVVPALIKRFHDARETQSKSVVVWGTGAPRREFLYNEDLADACIHLMKTYSAVQLVNIGVGHDVTIRELAAAVAATVGYTGAIEFDPSKPDGTPRKLVDVTRLHTLGWRATTTLQDGLKRAYADFLARYPSAAA
jgi:GDP-L-fucose synthase